MILRKPYALFIKLFRPMHFIIAVLLTFLSYKFYNIYLFFKGYIKTGHFSSVENITTYYVNNLVYVAIIFLILLFGLILVLFIYKKKRIISYLLIFFSQIFSLAFAIVVKKQLIALDAATIDVRAAIVLRDISVVLAVINILLMIWMTFRALGFNLKQFEFGKDLKELQIESKDSEEFEFSVDIDKNDIRTRWNRYKRLFKYYLSEYKKVITIIIIILAFIIGLVVLTSYLNREIIYKESEVVDLDGYKYKFKTLNSYVFETDYKGNKIDEKSKYIVVKFEMTNKNEKELLFDLTNAVLIGKKSYANVMTLYDSFRDIGVGYNGQKIKPGVTGEFIMVYPIDKKDNSSTFLLKLFNERDNFSVQLNPKKFNTVHKNNEVEFGSDLKIENSVLPNTIIMINNYNTNNKVIFSHNGIEYAVISNSVDKTNLFINYSYYMEDSSIYKMTGRQFIAAYAKVLITKNGKTQTLDVVDKTPNGVDQASVLSVSNEINDADTICLKFNIRNEEYYYYLKK